jgi:hypothetical protein
MIPGRQQPTDQDVPHLGSNKERAMRLNFWQWLGVILLIIGVVMIFRNKTGNSTDDTVQPTKATTTQPR